MYSQNILTKKVTARPFYKRPLGLTAPLSNNTLPMIHRPMNIQWPWFDLLMPPKVKCHEVYQWRIQVLRLRGAHFLGIRIAPTHPLRGFPEATIKVYTCIILGFRIAPPPPLSFFSWSHYKSLYCAFLLKPL